ncbi:LolA-like putative outer membrane lipoprotein chaperone [uncultured Parabacteroides sp.]|uniref:LolA-like putative outer membrane lipoprotein chaperone n=1 Tax=uncultured Parabacteroides sp. TaxID=512312 RepID=UPI0025E01B8F|nr:LolA-like putative outer membrane lipoprotein chaperone [uncultured Parabacteroides sp.]
MNCKLKITRLSVLLLCLLLGFNLGGRAQSATSVLDKAASAYEGSNGLKAHFTMQTRSDVQKVSESFDGTIDIKGDKFVLKTPDMITWFDGTTQWSYVERNEEVNVSTPTGEELQATNPALLLRSYKKGFSATLKGESTAPNGKAAYDIELTPKKKSDIIRVELQIEKFSGLPASIAVFVKNGLSNTIRIGKMETGVNQPDSFFVFNEKDYPDTEIVDLR